jgi:parallel beta-helix repeat protein
LVSVLTPMTKIILFLLTAVALVSAQTQIDLSKQKGVVPIINGGTGNPGISSVSVSPSALAFGSVQTTHSSPARSVAISNTGSNPVTVSSVSLSGAGAAHFTNSSICVGAPNAIDSGATCVEQVQYNPIAVGAETATLTVVSTAPVNPQNPLTVALSGTGTAAISYALSVNCGGSLGSGTITSNETPPLINAFCNPPNAPSGTLSNNYASGSTPILTATPGNNGSTFANFSGGGCSTSPCTVTMSAATNVTASFNPPTPQFVLNISGAGQGTGTVTSGSGGISCTSTAGVLSGTCNASYAQGTVVTLTEAPSGSCTGGACTFTSWGGGPGCNTLSTCAVTVNSPITVSANFASPQAGAPLQLIQTVPGGAAGTNNITGNWAAAQGAGDTLIIYGLIPDATTTVNAAVTDTSGNTYTQVTQNSCSPKVGASYTVVLYYAANILKANAGANTTTIPLSASPGGRQLFGLEYSGLTATPVDVCAAGASTGTAISSGNLTTNFANDLLTAANLNTGSIITASTGWAQRIFSTGNDAEDFQGVPIGTYSNAPTSSSSGGWTDIAAAWKTTGVTGTTVSFTIAGSGNGTGTITGNGLSCSLTAGITSGTCSVGVPGGSTLTLTATPSTGSAFTAYAGAGCNTSPTCVTAPITANSVVTASFSLAGTQNFYISPSGSDTTVPGCTSQASPCKSFAHAIPLLTPGSVLNLANGTYSIANGNGTFFANCGTTAHSGTSGAHVTIQALNERQAFLSGDGSANTLEIYQCAYWDVIGIHAESADLSVGNTFTGDAFGIYNSSYITLRRNIAAHPNRYGNVHPIDFYNSSNSLVEENEVYSFHRWGILIYGGSNNEVRRNYVNNRGYDQIGGGYSNNGSIFGIGPYESSGNIFENNISEDSATQSSGTAGIEVESSASNNTFFGNIGGPGLSYEIKTNPHTGMGQGTGNVLTNTVSVHPATFSVWARSTQISFDHANAFGTPGAAAGFQSDNDSSISYPSYAFTVSNSTAQGFSTGIGYNSTNVTGTCDHDNNFGNSSSYSGCTATNPNTANPAFGACYLWVPVASPLHGAGAGGTDIGANIEYEYVNGALTAIPLWSAASGSFRQGATVTGLNDVATQSLFDVQNRINAKQNGCAFRASYTGW